jgi:hypothetical protein
MLVMCVLEQLLMHSAEDRLDSDTLSLASGATT